MSHRRFLLSLSVILFSSALALALVIVVQPIPRAAAAPLTQVRYVNDNAAGGNSGASWANAFTHLQDALAAAQSGDEIWVASGVYTPGASVKDSFQLKDGVALYGGFAGNETSREQRDWQANVTVLSGDIDGNDGVDANGVVTNTDTITGTNAGSVLNGSGTDATAILDGFTLTAGAGSFGGGMRNSQGSPTLAHLIFSGNRAGFGGGLYNTLSSPRLTQVSFIHNYANFGGGMWNDNNSRPTLNQVLFDGNAGVFGGGLGNSDASPTLFQATLVNNTASSGGGMYNSNASRPAVTNASIRGNYASASGGGMYNVNSSLAVTNTIFSGNRAGAHGGGIQNIDIAFITVTNAIFSGNRAGSDGGGMMNLRSTPTIHNSIFWNNWDSRNDPASASMRNGDSAPTVDYSLVQGCNPGGVWQSACGADGGNNLADGDPLFIGPVDPTTAPTTTGNLRLWAGSPALDTGNNSFITGIATDLEGNPRIVNGTVDLGAYEAPANPPIPERVFLPLMQR